MRAYSSGVMPCSAAITGVTRISVLAVAMFKSGRIGDSSCCRLRGADKRFDHGAENDQAVRGAQGGFHGALGMRHQAGDVPLAVTHPRDVADGAVGIAAAVV